MMSQNIGDLYAEIDSQSNDSLYIAIHNNTNQPVCLFTGFLYSSAAKNKIYAIDQMLYLHRYDSNLGIYKLSFVPLKPFLRYSGHMPVHVKYYEEPGFPLTYEFSTISSKETFIYPVSKSSIQKREYIYDYFPQKYSFNTGYIGCRQNKKLKLDILKSTNNKKHIIKPAPNRNVEYITIEFAVYLDYDIIAPYLINPYSEYNGYLRFHNFYIIPEECNEQLNQYITVSLPLILNE